MSGRHVTLKALAALYPPLYRLTLQRGAGKHLAFTLPSLQRCQ